MRSGLVLGAVWCALAIALASFALWLAFASQRLDAMSLVTLLFLLAFAVIGAIAGIGTVRGARSARTLIRVASVVALFVAGFLFLAGGALVPPYALFIVFLVALSLYGLALHRWSNEV